MPKGKIRKAIKDIVKGPKVVSTHPAIERELERKRKRNTSVSGHISKDKVGIKVRIKW